MPKSENETSPYAFSRRRFLTVAGATGVLVGATRGAIIMAAPQRHEEANGYESRKGTYIRGEEVVFTVAGKNIRARVNERAFLATLVLMAQKTGTYPAIADSLLRYPLRIDLHDSLRVGKAAYVTTKTSRLPRICIPTRFLAGYFNAQQHSDAESLLESDSYLAHEVFHRWEEITPLFTAAEFVRPVIMGHATALAAQAGFSLGKFAGENPAKSETVARITQGLGTAVGSLIGLEVGDKVSNLLSPDELLAYVTQGFFATDPALTPYRGAYFQFEEV